MRYEDTRAMLDFTEVLSNDPGKAYDFISCNGYRFEKDSLIKILKEIIYSLSTHTNNSFYDGLYDEILGDVRIELDEMYDEEYQEYFKWIEEE